jgi:glutathione S-transferase
MDCFVALLLAMTERAGERMLTLYFAPGSSSLAVHIALHEVGVSFEARPMSFKNNDMRSPEFLAINPEGKVPTLLIDGRPLTEVAAILYYLAKRFPEAQLLPRENLEAEAQALSWMSFIASTLHPARRRGLDYARQVYGIADTRLGQGWALGQNYSIADIHLFRLYWRLFNSLKPAPGTFANLDAHYARMMARSAVQRTIRIESAIGYELPA